MLLRQKECLKLMKERAKNYSLLNFKSKTREIFNHCYPLNVLEFPGKIKKNSNFVLLNLNTGK